MEETSHLATHVTTATFEAEVLQFNGVAFVDFWAPWCGPCKVMGPRVEELAEKYKDNAQVKVCKLDIDENGEISEKYRILSIPTFKVFIKGEPSDQKIGAVATSELEMLVEEALQKLGSTEAK